MTSSLPDLCPLHASSTFLQSCDNQKCLQHTLPCPHGQQNLPTLTHWEPILYMLAFIIFLIAVISGSIALTVRHSEQKEPPRMKWKNALVLRSSPPSPLTISACAANSPPKIQACPLGSGGKAAWAPPGVTRDVELELFPRKSSKATGIYPSGNWFPWDTASIHPLPGSPNSS